LPKVAEGCGILLGKAGERGAGPLKILVDDDGRTVAEHGGLLHRRLDVGKSIAIKFKILDQRAMAHPHVKVGVQVESEARKHGRFGGAAAADARVAFEHDDFQAGAREVGRERQTVVTSANHPPSKSTGLSLGTLAGAFLAANLQR